MRISDWSSDVCSSDLMNLGAGRVVMQDLPRIDAAIADGSFARIPALQEAVATLKKSGGTAHVMGLVSPGGVHSHQDQIAALAELLAEADRKSTRLNSSH